MIRNTLLLAALASLLAACGATAPKKSTLPPEEAVALRAKERWDAIIIKDYKKAYSYLTAGARATTPYDNYATRLAKATLTWESAQVKNVVCEEPEVCVATLGIGIKVRSPAASFGAKMLSASPEVNENWLLGDDGQWYHLPDKTGR
ncbi:MAG: hypothetical protein R3F10_00705 [Lysobacteraceae bacterium]